MASMAIRSVDFGYLNRLIKYTLFTGRLQAAIQMKLKIAFRKMKTASPGVCLR